MINYLPSKILKKVAKKKAIENLVTDNLTLNKAAVKTLSNMDILSKKKVEEIAIRVINDYKKRAKKEIKSEVKIDSKYKYSPDELKQYGYSSKSTGLTSISEIMPDGPDSALVHYTENGFVKINSELRNKKIGTDTEVYVKDLDDSFKVSVLKKDTKLYRGVDGNFNLKNIKVGETITDNGYLSTSPDKGVAEYFANKPGNKGAVFEIETATGQAAVDTSVLKAGITNNESEILLPRDTKLEIISISEENGIKIIKARTPERTKELELSKEVKKEIADDPKLMVQRVENASLDEISKQIKYSYRGEYYVWLPSDAENPDPEHQLNYGRTFQIGSSHEMPGDRWGCRCGMQILVDETKLDLE